MIQRSGTRDGKRVRWSEGPYPNKAEAEAARIKPSKLTSTNAVRLVDHLESWLDRKRIEADVMDSDTRYEQYRKHVKAVTPWIDPELRLGDVQRSHIRSLWLDLLGRRGYSSKYVRNIQSTLSVVFNDAIDDGLITFNPVRDNPVPATSGPTRDIQILEDDEWYTLIDYLTEQAPHTPFALGTLIIAYTGMRAAEACGLTWQHVHPQRHVIEIRQQALKRRNPNRTEVVPYTKTRRNRSIAMVPDLAKVLEPLRPSDQIRFGPDDFVFRNTAGNVATSNSLLKWMSEHAYPATGVRDIGVHGLRHTLASHLLLAGVNEEKVAYQLGHSTSLTTRSIYTHVNEKRRRELVTDMQEVFDRGREDRGQSNVTSLQRRSDGQAT